MGFDFDVPFDAAIANPDERYPLGLCVWFLNAGNETPVSMLDGLEVTPLDPSSTFVGVLPRF